MIEPSQGPWRFVSADEAEVEVASGRNHYWHCKPDQIPGSNLLVVRVQMPPGGFHHFHYHPHMEEVLYFISGTAEQWIGNEKRMLRQGDSIYVAAGVVHATFNGGSDVMEFLAVLSPSNSPAPGTIQVEDQEPYKSWRPVP